MSFQEIYIWIPKGGVAHPDGGSELFPFQSNLNWACGQNSGIESRLQTLS